MSIEPAQSSGVHVLLTGPIRGSVVLADGTTVDVTPGEVYLDSPEAAAEAAHLIGERYQAEGHPDFLANPDVDFVHVPRPEFSDYEPHPEMFDRIETTKAANSELAARVEAQRPEVEARALDAFARHEEAQRAADTYNQEG